jgi:site-specific DNA-methyltransferase (adenine-specific)
MRFFMASAEHFRAAGWKYAQDCVWEKHNGSSFHADRLKRVHEHAVQFYPSSVPWADIYKKPVTTPDATARAVRRKKRPPHTGHIEASSYTSEDGGPRLMRSVIAVRSCHGYAEHPTQKPEGIIAPLIEFSCPPCGTVGDWFAGSGSVGVTALKLGRSYVGCEIDEGYYGKARARLDRAGNDLFAGGPMTVLDLTAAAVFSECRHYRYLLRRADQRGAQEPSDILQVASADENWSRMIC